MTKLTAFLGCLIFALSFGANGADRSKMCPEEEIPIAYSQWGGLFKDSTGVDFDLIEAVTKGSNCKLKKVVIQRSLLWSTFFKGDIALISGAAPTPDRVKHASFVLYLQQENNLIFNAKVPSNITTIKKFTADLSLKLGAIKGFKHGPHWDVYVDHLAASGRVILVEDTEALFKGLNDGAYDGVLAFPINYTYMFKRLNMRDNVRFYNWKPQPFSPLGVVLHNKYFTQEHVKVWQEEIQKLRNSKELLNIYKPYMNVFEAETSINF